MGQYCVIALGQFDAIANMLASAFGGLPLRQRVAASFAVPSSSGARHNRSLQRTASPPAELSRSVSHNTLFGMPILAHRILVVSALSAALSMPYTSVKAQADTYQIGQSKVILPLPQGFSPACRENQRLSAGMAAMTPPDSRLVTCWVESGIWESVKSGRLQAAYPAMFLTHAEKLGDNWSQSDFEKLKALAQQQLPSLMGDSNGSAEQIRQQNDALAKEGFAISAELLRRRYAGIFDLRPRSFSYLIFREAKVIANGAPAQSHETVAITTVLHKGSVVALTTVEQNMTEQAAVAARRRSIAWLEQFSAANRQ